MYITRIVTAFIVFTIFVFGQVELAHAERGNKKFSDEWTISCGYVLSPPFLMRDEKTGEFSGIDYEIWTAIGNELGAKIDWSQSTGAGIVLEGIKSGRFDAICSQIWVDSKRVRSLTLTNPVLFSKLKLYGRQGDTRFKGSIEDINSSGPIISAIERDVTQTMIENTFPDSSIDLLPAISTKVDLIGSLVSQKSDIVLIDQASADAIVKLNQINNVREVAGSSPLYNLPSYYAFNIGQYELRDMVNLALRNIINDGRLDKIVRDYSASLTVPKKDY